MQAPSFGLSTTGEPSKPGRLEASIARAMHDLAQRNGLRAARAQHDARKVGDLTQGRTRLSDLAGH